MKKVCKPYKKNIRTWHHIKGEDRESMGRTIIKIEIGEKQYFDENENIIKTAPLCEDIYIDVLKGIMFEKNKYQTYFTLECEANIAVSYNGRIVIHNDYIAEHLQAVTEAMQDFDTDILCEALRGFVINENSENKYNSALKKLTSAINKKCKGKNFSAAFIGFALKEYLCEDMRIFDERYEDLRYLSYNELMKNATDILKNRLKSEAGGKFEQELKNEIYYRFLAGDIVQKGV